ncbi:DUF350 domain-containing protein [Tropicimonas sp.]|uniref:DUF350 domain-containing protein n=1 Tax=Tropicimonas sp. TaxID=2067044 RepID=UPI003A872C17
MAGIQLAEVFGTIFYTFLGFGLLVICWLVIERITPFSLRREIEEDHNIAIAVMMAALFLSLSIIIAAVILS